MIKAKCEICIEEFNSYPSWNKSRRTCSRVCAAKLKSIEKRGTNHHMFGKHHTEISKEKNRLSHIGKGSEIKMGNKNPMWGKPSANRGISPSLESREKNRQSNLGRIPWNKNKIGVMPTGANHHNWQGGITPYYRVLRVARLKAVGGSHTKTEWETLQAQYNWTCPCCKKSEVKLTKDHIIPVRKGGSDNIENIQPLCGSCNSKKHIKIIKYDYQLVNK